MNKRIFRNECFVYITGFVFFITLPLIDYVIKDGHSGNFVLFFIFCFIVNPFYLAGIHFYCESENLFHVPIVRVVPGFIIMALALWVNQCFLNFKPLSEPWELVVVQLSVMSGFVIDTVLLIVLQLIHVFEKR